MEMSIQLVLEVAHRQALSGREDHFLGAYKLEIREHDQQVYPKIVKKKKNVTFNELLEYLFKFLNHCQNGR